MDDDNTVWQPTEPTTPNTYNNPYDSIPIPPPPPRKPSWWVLAVALVIIAILLFSSAALTYWTVIYRASATQPTPTTHVVPATPTSVPTHRPTSAINQNYTARDIVRHMQAIDNTVFIGTTGETIWTFSHNNYYIGVHATSSVQFTGCPIGGCADVSHYGLWVYANPQDAATAYVQVNTDSQSCTDTSPYSSGMYVVCGIPEQEYVHGRCLLLNSVDTSIYGQVVTQYCV